VPRRPYLIYELKSINYSYRLALAAGLSLSRNRSDSNSSQQQHSLNFAATSAFSISGKNAASISFRHDLLLAITRGRPPLLCPLGTREASTNMPCWCMCNCRGAGSLLTRFSAAANRQRFSGWSVHGAQRRTTTSQTLPHNVSVTLCVQITSSQWQSRLR